MMKPNLSSPALDAFTSDATARRGKGLSLILLPIGFLMSLCIGTYVWNLQELVEDFYLSFGASISLAYWGGEIVSTVMVTLAAVWFVGIVKLGLERGKHRLKLYCLTLLVVWLAGQAWQYYYVTRQMDFRSSEDHYAIGKYGVDLLNQFPVLITLSGYVPSLVIYGVCSWVAIRK